MEHLRNLFVSLKDNVNLVLFKFILGIIDVTTDIVSGHNLISGQFLLGLYFASKTREDYKLNNRDYTPWGILTLFFVWFPGLIRITTVTIDQQWRGLPAKLVIKRIFSYFILLTVWPIFSLLM